MQYSILSTQTTLMLVDGIDGWMDGSWNAEIAELLA